MQLVKLHADSPRGGILTEGTILGVTSNPTRTSPVKRGLFILDSILGTPPAPPPPNIPPLEDAAQKITGHPPSLRETLAALESRLDPKTFVRISRSVIINARRIKDLKRLFYGGWELTLQTGVKLTLSRRYRDKLEQLGIG